MIRFSRGCGAQPFRLESQHRCRTFWWARHPGSGSAVWWGCPAGVYLEMRNQPTNCPWECGETLRAKAIKDAFRKKSFDSHPDRGGDAGTFNQVKRAYEILGPRTEKAILHHRGRLGKSRGQLSRRGSLGDQRAPRWRNQDRDAPGTEPVQARPAQDGAGPDQGPVGTALPNRSARPKRRTGNCWTCGAGSPAKGETFWAGWSRWR